MESAFLRARDLLQRRRDDQLAACREFAWPSLPVFNWALDIHWNISSPGWAKHAWSSLFAPWNAGATIFVFN
jgi:hypothetical protein